MCIRDRINSIHNLKWPYVKKISRSKKILSISKKLLEGDDVAINDLKVCIEDLSKASQSFAEKLYAETQNDSPNPSSDESDDVVEGEVVEDE